MKKNAFPLFTAFLWMILAFAACKPDDPIPPDPQPGTFQLEFLVKWGNQNLALSQKYLAPDGRNYQIDVLKFFVSRLALLTPSDSVVNVDDVALVDLYRANSNIVSGSVPAGSYTGLRFNMGLDYDLNHSDQTSYPTDHPLSTTTGMYWTWATRYIFTMIEGRADTTGGHATDDIFLYHSGADSLVRPMEFRNLNIVVGENETKKHSLTLDMQKVFWGANDTIDIVADPNTHTMDNPALASRVTRLLAAAFQ
jgi:hypothetical protein